MDIKEKIKQFIQSELLSGKDVVNLEFSNPLITTGIIDSLGTMKLITFLENTFLIKFEDEEILAENFETINTMASLILKKNSMIYVLIP